MSQTTIMSLKDKFVSMATLVPFSLSLSPTRNSDVSLGRWWNAWVITYYQLFNTLLIKLFLFSLVPSALSNVSLLVTSILFAYSGATSLFLVTMMNKTAPVKLYFIDLSTTFQVLFFTSLFPNVRINIQLDIGVKVSSVQLFLLLKTLETIHMTITCISIYG